jgi:chromate reductase, NAD(P)H dehydrogenase (quinone)
MADKLKFLGFAGSLRQGSYNRALLTAAQELLPDDASLEIFDLDGIPLYNADIETPLPVKVQEFKQKIKAADAIIIATPEYNRSIPGVLKNAIDWASRPTGDNSFDDKPLAIMSASIGMFGADRAQFALRQTCVFLNMHALNRPEITVNFAPQKFDKDGKLTDETTRKFIKELMQSLVTWTKRLKPAL